PILIGRRGEDMAETPKLKTYSFGSCDIVRAMPPVENLAGDNRVLNIAISFEEALKLNLAIEECIRQLNAYNRSTKAGKRTGMNIALYLDKKRILVNETNLPKSGS